MPEGNGPFPVILMVHGNHLDRDFSDAGYSYLGALLASQGNIAISVDQNFLNGGLTNFNRPLNEENDARGWLLLKHLQQIRHWSSEPANPFSGKADLDNVVLIGHSRGGEAVCIAAAFNHLPYYPDNAQEVFEFGFGIKGIVAIAQVDGQYYPSNQETPLSNIDYLAIQGSMDADLNSYAGLRMMNRVSFTDSLFHFKTGIYIERANHGQFNESWGVFDIGYPEALFLNRRELISKDAQEKIAQTYIAAFVQTSLGKDNRYLELFRDYRTGRHWIPKLSYISQYQDSRTSIVADFEEDLDITTASFSNGSISFRDLARIYEEKVYLKKGNSGTKSVCIGWNNSKDTVPGIYGIDMGYLQVSGLDVSSSFQFDVAVIDMDPGEREEPEGENDEAGVKPFGDEAGEVAGDEEEAAAESVEDTMDGEGAMAEPGSDDPGGNSAGEVEEPSYGEEDDEEEPVLFSIRLIDGEMDSAMVSLEAFFPLNHPIPAEMFKLEIFERDSDPEIIPQHIEIPLKAFVEVNTDFDPAILTRIEFVFDQGEKGMIALDNIGFTDIN
jgi:hypothetical protein